MKKSIKMLMVLAASIITLAACNKEEKDITVQGEKETFTVNFTASSDELTKVYFGDKTDEGKYPVYWNGGERVAVIAIPVDADNNFIVEGIQAFMGENAPVAEAINDGRNASFSINVEKNEDAASWIFSARCPTETFFTYGVAESGRPFLTYAIPTVQTPLSSSPDPSAMYLSSFSTAQEADGVVNVDFKFRHGMVNYLKMSLKNLDESANITEVRLAFAPIESDTGDKAFGDFRYEFDYILEELRASGDITGGVNEATIKTSNRDDIWVVLNVGCEIRNRDLTVTVVTDKGNYTKTINFGSYNLSPLGGQVGSFGINFADIEPVVENNTYVLVTSNLSDWSGEYLIVSEDKVRIADTKLSSDGYLTTTTDFILSDDGASIDADPQNQFTISPASDGKYYITNAAGEYLHLPNFDKTPFDYTSDLSGASAGYAQWSLSIAQSGKAVINYGIVGNSQRNIGDNRDRDFRGYAGGSFCYLYKYIGASGKTHQTLSFPEESYQVGVDDSFTAPELSGAQTTVTYESSETSVATVDPSTGAITIVGPGSTVITATAEETDSYYSASASYTLTVVGNDCYVKVEANQSDWSGQYLIVYEGGDTPLAFNGGLTTLDAIRNYIEVTIDGKTIAKTAETTAAEFTIAPKSGASASIYSLKSASGKYISGTNSTTNAGNGIASSTSADNFEITFDYNTTDGLTIFSKSKDQNMVLRYNKASDQTRFRFYKSGQQPVALYKYNGAQKETQTISFAEAEISWTVGTDCTFETAKQGQTVTGAQTTVTYSSSDSEVATVANDGKVTPHKAGTVTITATAAEDDTYASATATYTLNIVDNTDYSGDYVIVYATATEKYAMPAYTSGNNIKGISYTLNAENKITADDIDQCKYEIRKVTEGTLAGKYTIKDVNGLYIYAAGDIGDNYLKAAATPSTDYRYYWTISQNGDVFDIIAASSNNNELRFNDNSGSQLFSCYASTSPMKKVSLVPWSNVHVDTTPRIIVADADKTQNVAAAGKTITIDCTTKNITGDLGIAKSDAYGIIDGTPTYANGKLTIAVKENTESASKTATVTLSYDGATSVVITINQEAKVVGGDEYQKYTGTLVEGDYVIYYSGKAMKNTVSSSRLDYVEVTPQNDKIVNPDAGIVWHIAPSGSYWTIYNASAARYAASTGADNKAQLSSDLDDKSLWTASGTSTYEFVNKYNSTNGKNAYLRNNGTYGFACYKSGTGGALTLYKKASGTDDPVATLTSIAVKSAPTKVSYSAGETFNPAGLVITKTMSDGSTVDVTYSDSNKSDFTFNPSLTTPLATTNTSVTITYGGKTCSQAITVSEAPVEDVITYQHVFNAKPDTGDGVTLSGIKWNISATALNGYNSGNYAGVQIGTKSNPGSITLTSSSSFTYNDKSKISEVRLWLNTGGSAVTPTVTIGGKPATSDGTSVVKNSTAGTDWTNTSKVTFTPGDADTGIVVIDIQTEKAGYICAVEIDVN